MRWKIEDTPEQAEFRKGFRGWLQGVLPEGWMDAIDAGDDDRYAEVRAASNFNPFEWMRVLGESGYAAPLWPKAYGGMDAETWAIRVIREE